MGGLCESGGALEVVDLKSHQPAVPASFPLQHHLRHNKNNEDALPEYNMVPDFKI